MTPLGWKYVGFVWGYAILWRLFTDRIKLFRPTEYSTSCSALLAKKQVDLGPQIASQAYELYSSGCAARVSRTRTGWKRSARCKPGGTSEAS